MSARILFALLALLTLIDSILGAFVFKNTGSLQLANIVLFSKYVIFSAGCASYILKVTAGGGFLRHEFYGLLYLVVVGAMIVVLMVVHPEHSAAGRFYGYVFPVIIYFFGCNLSRSEVDWRYALKVYITLHITVTVLCGIPIYIIGPASFWQNFLEYGSYIVRVKGFDDVIGGLPGNFYYDPYFTRVLRFVGAHGDPLAVGYSSMILAVAAIYAYPRARFFIVPLLALFIFLAITRAALLSLLFAPLLFWLLRERSFTILVAACAIGLAIVYQFGGAVAEFLGDSSSEGHVASIGQMSSFLEIGGVLGGSLVSGRSTVFEPGFLNILFIFGIFPLILLLIFIGGIFRQHADDRGALQFVSVLMLAGVLTLTVFSASFFAVTSSWFAWFIAGLTSRTGAAVALAAPRVSVEHSGFAA